MGFKRPFTTAEWLETPEAVRQYIELLDKRISRLSGSVEDLKWRTEKVEQHVNRNSQNSNQPPSTDGLLKKAATQKQKVQAQAHRSEGVYRESSAAAGSDR